MTTTTMTIQWLAYSVAAPPAHIINLYGLASFSLFTSWNITIYLAPKAKRKWSIRCSGRTRVISHFTSRHIFVTYCELRHNRFISKNYLLYTPPGSPPLYQQSYTNYIDSELLLFSQIFSFYLIVKRNTVTTHINTYYYYCFQ